MADGLAAPLPFETPEDDLGVTIEGDSSGGEPKQSYDPDTRVLKIEQPDGSAIFLLDQPPPKDGTDEDDDDFYENLADKITAEERGRIVAELLAAIDADDQSRADWLKTRALGIDMLGFRLEEPRSDAGNSSAPLEGMSVVRHTLLPEAVIRFQANAIAELLPASGPVKVRSDAPPKPKGAQDDAPQSAPGIGHNGGPALDDDVLDDDPDELAGKLSLALQAQQPPQPNVSTEDELAEALEQGFNHYLTVTDKGYRADTARMLFSVGFGGCAFKKVYYCPIKRRPISRMVDAKDLIVSNEATDLEDAGRVTHRVMMRKSLLRRMQLAGAYRDIELGQPDPRPNPVDEAQARAQGFTAKPQRPEDFSYQIEECYCEIDVAGFEHKEKGEPTGLALPYKVSIERSSQQLLELRRNWKKDDETFTPRRVFVKYGFVQALGFYDVGLLHILGNADRALTAAWREMLDAGMFSSFPGFLYAKAAGRQRTNQFRVPPGGGIEIDTGGLPIGQVVMPLPYREPGPAMLGLIQHVEQSAQRIGGTAEMPASEGRLEAPVGTTLALIEQATKIIAAVHVGLHAAQSEEFQLLKERFREDPESFWRHNPRCRHQWEVDQFLEALDDCDLVPAADPNTPSHMHRIMKAVAVKQLQAMNPQLYDPQAVDARILKMIGFTNPEELFTQTPAPPIDPSAMAPPAPPPDPNKMAALQLKAQEQQQEAQARMAEMAMDNQAAQQDRAAKSQMALVESADRAADRASRERVAQTRIQAEQLKLQAAEQKREVKNAVDYFDEGFAAGGRVKWPRPI